MEEYLLFCDETKKTSTNPYFVFGGLAVKRSNYINDVIPKINTLKRTYFSDTDIVFHYTEMKGNKDRFSVLSDTTKRNSFYTDFRNTISSLDFTAFAVYYNQDAMQSLYKKKSTGHYNIGFIKLLENYLHFLIENNGYGNIVVESRTLKENAMLLDTFYAYKNNGSVFFKPEIVQKHISSISFTIKEDNCVGLQIADFIPLSISRILNKQTDKQSMGRTFQQKIYKHATSLESIVGLKQLL